MSETPEQKALRERPDETIAELDKWLTEHKERIFAAIPTDALDFSEAMYRWLRAALAELRRLHEAIKELADENDELTETISNFE